MFAGPVTQATRPPNQATVGAPNMLLMRAVFYGYLAVILSGIVYFSIIGLTHH
jgi:hypothetical protein